MIKPYAVESAWAHLRNDQHDLLGLPQHVRQGQILVAADSKAAAVRALDAVGLCISPARVRVADRYPLAMVLLNAGAFGDLPSDLPAVVTTPSPPRDGDPVVRTTTDGESAVVGHLSRRDVNLEFVPFGPAPTPPVDLGSGVPVGDQLVSMARADARAAMEVLMDAGWTLDAEVLASAHLQLRGPAHPIVGGLAS